MFWERESGLRMEFEVPRGTEPGTSSMLAQCAYISKGKTENLCVARMSTQ